MKSFLLISLVLCIFSAAGAAGQVSGGVMNAEPQMFEMPDHPQQASQQGMGQARDIMERTVSVSTHGEKPMWEAMQEAPATAVTPLGDAAREIRKEHALAKKASVVWMN